MGLAGSVFAYLMASSGVNSKQDLTSAASKYAAKSGVEIAAYELGQNPPPSQLFSQTPPNGLSCPAVVVPPYGVSVSHAVSSSGSTYYIYSYNLYPGSTAAVTAGKSNIGVDNYTPAFCAIMSKTVTPCPGGAGGNTTTYWIITSNGFAGGTQREVTAEAGIPAAPGNGVICAESELPNSG